MLLMKLVDVNMRLNIFKTRNLFLVISLLFFVIFSHTAYAGPIYVFKKDGVIKFSSKPPPPGISAKVFTAKSAKYSVVKTPVRGARLYPDRYSTIIDKTARRYQMDPALIKAVIHAESAFNPRAVSKKGAKGLMQLMPSNIRIYGVNNPFSPSQNIKAGSGLLAKLLRKYKGDIRLALAAYNAGEGAVKKYRGMPPFKETKEYVPKVLSLFHRYRAYS